MASAPGTTVNVVTGVSPAAQSSSTGTAFFIGQSARGQVAVAVPVLNITDYQNKFGGRTANAVTSLLYDAVDVFFAEGGQALYVSRVSGASGAVATHTLVDRAGTPLSTLSVSANGPGIWGNGIQVAVANGTVANSFVLSVTYTGVNGLVTEVSPNLFSPTDAVNWAQSYSQTVTITNLGSATAAPNNNPAVVAATSLTGGVDDTAPADSVWVTALSAFVIDLGPGQVAAPGRTTPVVWEGLSTHAQGFNRWPLLDAENVAAASTITADAGTVQTAVTDPSYGWMLAPWPLYAGPPTGSATPAYPRTVAPSALVAGLLARSDGAGNTCDVAAAGNNGISRTAIGLSQPAWDSSDRAALEAAGVGVIRNYRGQIQLYGYTSMATDVVTWGDVGNCRLRMQIVDGVRQIGDGFEFADIDGQGQTAAAFGGSISAFLTGLYNKGALYGVSPAAAFFVNTGSSINTPATAQSRELLASVGVRMSSTATMVVINVTRYPVTQNLP